MEKRRDDSEEGGGNKRARTSNSKPKSQRARTLRPRGGRGRALTNVESITNDIDEVDTDVDDDDDEDHDHADGTGEIDTNDDDDDEDEDDIDIDEINVDDHLDGNSTSAKTRRKSKKKQTSKSTPRESGEAHRVYDEVWTEDDEQKLQGSWTREDQALLEELEQYEITALRKSDDLFGLLPYDLLPKDKKVATVNNLDFKFEGRSVKNTNWSKAFAEGFVNIVSCPAFKDNPDFMRHAIATAVYWRLGGEKPTSSHLASRDNAVIKTFEDEGDLELDGIAKAALHRTLKKHFGIDRPPHWEFLKGLKSIVKSKGKARGHLADKNPDGIVSRDLEAVGAAWDLYVEGKGGLQTLKEAKKETASRRGPPKAGEETQKAFALRLKKNWILDQRRLVLRAEKEADEESEQVKMEVESPAASMTEGLEEDMSAISTSPPEDPVLDKSPTFKLPKIPLVRLH